MSRPRYSTAIIQAPSGRYVLRGSVPASLLEECDEPVFATEAEAIAAVLCAPEIREHPEHVIQRADCSVMERVQVAVLPDGAESNTAGPDSPAYVVQCWNMPGGWVDVKWGGETVEAAVAEAVRLLWADVHWIGRTREDKGARRLRIVPRTKIRAHCPA